MSTKIYGSTFSQYGLQQIIAGLCTGFAVTPINTIVDKSIIEHANGKTPLWTGVANGFKRMLFNPKIFFTAYQFKWILLVYHATYVTSNLADHVRLQWIDPSLSKLFLTFAVNTSLSLIKDKKLAQKLGNGQSRKFPISSLNLFFMRDIIAMASAFTLPSIFGKYIQSNSSLSQSTSLKIAQLTSPVMVQLVATPIHLLGLDLYNRPELSYQQRMKYLKSIYTNSVVLRMLRFLPAYGIGGIVNIELRKYFNRKNQKY